MNQVAATCGLALSVVGFAFEPTAASACGGFFCSSTLPVNQAAERIIFAQAADGTVTAIIQIQYSGPAERFAWLLPVAGSPSVSVSSNAAFSALQSATNPQYSLTWRDEGWCREQSVGVSATISIDGSVVRRDPVDVVDQGSVGPYDYVVLSVEPGDDSVEAFVGWLGENSFDVTSAQAELLRPYIDSGMNLLAFRLSKGNDTGSIRPVRIEFGRGLASIPIRPTAVAASSDMGVLVWVLGPSRAVPLNYLSLELNEALINWFNPTPTYNAVVTAAANEAGGQGFVTELAGSTAMAPSGSSYRESIYPEAFRVDFEALAAIDWSRRFGDLLERVVGSYGQLDGIREALSDAVPLPPRTTVENVLACPSCYSEHFNGRSDVDPAALIAALRRHVFEPWEATAALFDEHPYVTRLYTTMSADEMTVDPMFDFNADLGDYSSQHTAERVTECGQGTLRSEAPWRVELANGRVVRGRSLAWPLAAGSMPANSRTIRIGASGEGEVVEDHAAAIEAALAAHNSTISGPTRRIGGGGACSASSLDSTWPVLLVIAAVIIRRRRR